MIRSGRTIIAVFVFLSTTTKRTTTITTKKSNGEKTNNLFKLLEIILEYYNKTSIEVYQHRGNLIAEYKVLCSTNTYTQCHYRGE